MPIQTEKELSEQARGLWLKSQHAVELRNYGYAISLIQAILKESPGFLDGRKRLRKVELINTKGKKSFMSGLSTASLKGAGMVKKDPVAAMELAEKNLETDPTNAQINHLLKEAAKAAGYPEIAAFALETIVETNPTDTKTMHELGQFYMMNSEADKAVAVYSKIAEINPADIEAVRLSKNAAAAASIKKGNWEKTDSDFRSKLKNKDESDTLEKSARTVKSAAMIDQALGELTPQWESDQSSVDLTRRIAKLWEERLDQAATEENIDGAYYYYYHANELVGGADQAIGRKLSDLQIRKIDLQAKAFEDWFAQGGDEHEDAAAAREQLDALKQQKSELLVSEARKRVERNPTDLQFAYELGEQLVNAKMYTDAIKELQRARQNPNARLKAMNLLGQCYTEKGMLDLAVKQFQDCASEIIAMDATKKEVLYKLGLVYERMGKKEESLKCMKDIYEVDYGYMDVAQRVEQSYGG